MSAWRGFAADLAGFAGWRGARALAAMIAGGLVESVGLAMLLPLLMVIATPAHGRLQRWSERGFALAGVHSQLGRLALLLALFVAVIVVRAVVLSRRDRMLLGLQIDFTTATRTRLLGALARAQWSRVAGLRHARLLQAVGPDLDRVASAAQSVLQMTAAMIMLVAQWLLVLLLSPVLAVAAVGLGVLAAALLVPTLRRAARLGQTLASGRLEIAHGAGQLLGGLKAAMAQDLQHAFLAELAAVGEEQAAQRMVFLRRNGRAQIAGTTAAAIGGAAAVLVGVAAGTPLLALVAVLAVFTRMLGPAMLLQQQARYLADLVPAHAAILALEGELAGGGTAKIATPTPLPSRATVRFAEVGYAHADGAGVAGLSLDLGAGEFVAVSGPSGAGKTTFIDLLAGLLQPQTGTIAVGGVPLDAASLPGWQTRLAYVGQDTFLFHDTLRRNLLLGAAEEDAVAVERALALTGADALVASLPAGLDTVVAERGGRLSGGQRQRIALARALLRRPELLILDEATNALDLAAERAIMARLAALKPRPAILVVAHRPETLAQCERVLTFADGRLIRDESMA